jgi:hypothetical protein
LQNFSFRARAAACVVSLLSVLIVFFPRQAQAVQSFTECKFSPLQVFDVQWNISDGTLNISGITAPYDEDFNQVQADSEDYYQFVESQETNETYGLNLFNSDDSLLKIIHQTGSFRAMGEDFLFYEGSGFFGTVITTTEGFAYGSSASLPVSQESPTNEQISSFASCSSTPIAEVGPAPTNEVDSSTTINTATSGNIAIPNAGFETGDFTGWEKGPQTGTLGTTIAGNGTGVSIFNGSRTFTHGSHGAIGNQFSSNEEPNPYYAPAVNAGSWKFSPKNNTYAALLQPKNNEQSFNQAMSAIGISEGDITQLRNRLTSQASASGFGGGNPTDAAWITREVSLTAGVTYTMSWNYVGTDYVPFNDGSITSLVAINTPSPPTITVNNSDGSYALLGFTNPGTGDYSTNSYGSTGWQISTYEVSVTGTYKLGFAVFNLDDTALSPALMIDNAIGETDKCSQNGNDCVSFGGVVSNNPTAPTIVTETTTTTTTTTTPPTTTTTNPPVPSETTTPPAPPVPLAPLQPMPGEQPQEPSDQTEEEKQEPPASLPESMIPEETEQTSPGQQQPVGEVQTVDETSDESTDTQSPIQLPEDSVTAPEAAGEIVFQIEDLAPEEIIAVIEDLLSGGITEELAVALVSSAEVLKNITAEQAAKIFSLVPVNDLTDEQAAAIVAAVQAAPTEIRESFENEINIYGGKFDTYVALGSTIDVGTRRAVIAVNLVAASVAVAATGLSSRGSTGGSGPSNKTSNSSLAARREDEEEEAGEIAGDGLEWIKAISIYKLVNGKKTINWRAFMRKFLYSFMNLGFTLAGAVVLFYTLSGMTRTIAMWSFGLAFAAAMYLAMKEPEEN